MEAVDPVGEILSGKRAGDPILVDLAGDEGGVVVEPAEPEHPPPRRMAHEHPERIKGHRLVHVITGRGAEKRDLIGRPGG